MQDRGRVGREGGRGLVFARQTAGQNDEQSERQERQKRLQWGVVIQTALHPQGIVFGGGLWLCHQRTTDLGPSRNTGTIQTYCGGTVNRRLNGDSRRFHFGF